MSRDDTMRDDALVEAGEQARLQLRIAALEQELAERRRNEELQRALYEIAALSSVDSGQH